MAFSAFFQRLEQGVFRRYMGVEGGRIFRAQWAQKLEGTSAVFKKLNNVLFSAPGFKWTLSIVPLMNAITGKPDAEKIDINTHASLVFTGAVWAYYSMLVRPKSWPLFSVSIALLFANGWQCFRRYNYNRTRNTTLPVD